MIFNYISKDIDESLFYISGEIFLANLLCLRELYDFMFSYKSIGLHIEINLNDISRSLRYIFEI